MAEWRVLQSWSREELTVRLALLSGIGLNFEAAEEEMTCARGWLHTWSESEIASDADGGACLERARVALTNFEFSDPAIVTAHFNRDAALLHRRLLLEVKVLGLRYLCPAVVNRVRNDLGEFGFRYDTLTGHIERGVEWFVVTQDSQGRLRFRIEARWKGGDLPNWWSALGFELVSGRYQRKWHREAHRRMSRLVHEGAPHLVPPGIDPTFTYHRYWKDPL